MTEIIHLTLNSGHVQNSPRSEVENHVVEALSPIVKRGGGEVAGWNIQMVAGATPGSAGFTLRNRGLWIASCYMAWRPEADTRQWDLVRRLYQPTLVKPACLPWLAVQVMPEAFKASSSVMLQVGDLERCIAWTVLEIFREEVGA